ncbi:hypothetical protein GGS21DRAFT_509157 [Xylaria nigripes]|nr:hypothetical protein GGS21DRAFT_509157 [Xylaria nigripes]
MVTYTTWWCGLCYLTVGFSDTYQCKHITECVAFHSVPIGGGKGGNVRMFCGVGECILRLSVCSIASRMYSSTPIAHVQDENSI